jgi:hypothetical protein
MQNDTAQADSLPRTEIRRNRRVVITKTNAAKGSSVPGVQFDAESGQLTAGARQDAFAAGLVNRRLKCICEENIDSVLSQCNGSGQARRTTAHDQYIGCECHKSPTFLV